MTLKEYIWQKAEEISRKAKELDEKYQSVWGLSVLRDYAKNNGRFEVINDIIDFMQKEEICKLKENICQTEK